MMSVSKILGISWNLAPYRNAEFARGQTRLGDTCLRKRFSSGTNLPHIMAAAAPETSSSAPKIQLYPEKTPPISDFWKEKYEKDAKKYWDLFYKRNANRFFKDRHYLDKEWGQYFSDVRVAEPSSVVEETGPPEQQGRAILEIGCGTGNTVYPLIRKYPQAYIYACDFSKRAVDLVKAHEDYDEKCVKAFVCDVTSDSLCETIAPASVDVITLIFVLSAIAPGKMPAVVRNLKSVLKPGGCILLRDYAVGDLAQERFISKDQQISENFYVRGDGTRAYYFSEDALRSLFVDEGFECEEMKVHCRQLENRSRKIVMDRRWIQAVFHLCQHSVQMTGNEADAELLSPSSKEFLQPCGSTPDALNSESSIIDTKQVEETLLENGNVAPNNEVELVVDLTEGWAAEFFGGAPPAEPLEVTVGSYTIHAKCLPKDSQHTYASTGFLLWDSANAFAELLAANPDLTRGKSVLELGCGSVGLCSLMSSLSAERVVATDGDIGALNLLQENLSLNKESFRFDCIACRHLEWGKEDEIETVRAASNGYGFQLIIGTDVVYVQDAVPLLFKTARALLATEATEAPMLILCHRIRKVAESDIVLAANSHGFTLVGLWDSSSKFNEVGSITQSHVESLFKQGLQNVGVNYKALQIMCLSPS